MLSIPPRLRYAVRRESVQVHVDSNLSDVFARDAAATALLTNRLRALERAANGLDTRLTAVNGNLTSTNAGLGDFATRSSAVERSTRTTTSSFDGMTRSSNQTGQSINQLTGRLGLFADAALILGPGLIPIAAVGAQAVGGLAVALGGVVATGAAAAIALNGVGDATKAIDAFQQDRTPENLAKAREEFEKLGPAAQRFVLEFQKAQPLFKQLRDDVAAEFLPGLTAAMDDLDVILPKVSAILQKAGAAGGGIVEDAANSLAGGRFDEFFAFAEDEMPRAMQSLARTMGDLAHGAAEMFMALDPGNDRFLSWLEDVGQGFDNWASSADGRDSIQSFLEYARENGPKVAEFFNSLIGALAAIAEASAPIGGEVLDALSAVLGVIETIADSDLATPLLAAAVAMRVYSRAASLAAAGQARFTAAMVQTNQASVTAAQFNRAGAVGASVNRWNPGYSGVRGQGDYGAHLAGALTAPRPQDIRAQQAAQRSQLMRGGGMALGVGLLASGVTDDINKTNTAMLTLAGTMAGPYGAAAGFVAGSFLDMQAAAGSARTEIDAFNTTLSNGATLPQLGQAADAQRDSLTNYLGSIDSIGDSLKTFGKDPAAFYDVLDGSNDRLKNYADAAGGAGETTRVLGRTFLQIGDRLNGTNSFTKASDLWAPNLKNAQLAMEQVQPTLDRLGITLEDVGNMNPTELRGFIDQVVELSDAASKPVSPVQDLAAAIGGANGEILDTAKNADRLRTALDALLSPNMDLTAANDNWTTSLRTLNEDLAKNKTLVGDSKSAIQNRAAVMKRIVDLQDKIGAQAAAGGKGATREELADTLREGRSELVKLGDQLGIGSEQMSAFLSDQGLSWAAVNEVIRQNAATARQETAKVGAAYDAMPTAVQTYLTTNGVPETVAEVDRLVAKYGLTEEQRTALISLRDQASGRAGEINRLLDYISRSRSVTITARAVTTTVENVIRNVTQNAGRSAGGRRSGAQSADGSTVPKTGLPYADRHPYLLADGEEIISNRHGQADRNRPLLKAINAGLLADGGTTGDPFPRITAAGLKGMSLGQINAEYRETMRDLKGFQRNLKLSTSALEKERQKREDFKSYRTEVAGSLSGELTGNGLAGFDAGVSANRNDARAALWALQKAKKNGLDGPLFDLVAASGDINLIDQFGDLNRRQIAQREYQYGAARSAQNALGNFASVERYDATIGSLDKNIKRLDKTVRRLGKDVERGAERGTQLGAEKKRRRTSTGTRAGR